VLLVLLLSTLCAGVTRQQDALAGARANVTGRIVGYSFAASLRMISGNTITPSQDEMLLLVERWNGAAGGVRYVKLRYKFVEGHDEDLPEEMLAVSRSRSFVLERDEGCDETLDSLVYGHMYPTPKGTAKAYRNLTNLQRLRGAEKIRLPRNLRLPCYSFESDGFEKPPAAPRL
jgi:hypothetical protein